MTPPRVLIVDDSRLALAALAAQLDAQQWEVREAASGESALAHIPLVQPDLVLVDMRLPGLDGLEVCRRLRADPVTQRLPVIVMTGSPTLAERRAALRAGADEYLDKTSGLTDLAYRLRLVLGLRAAAPAP